MVAVLLSYAGELFIRSLRSTVGPLIFVSMICCVNSSLKITSSAPAIALGSYAVTTVCALLEAMVAFALVRPGKLQELMSEPYVADGAGEPPAPSLSLLDTLLNLGRSLVPDNALRALVNGELLSIVSSGVAIGLAILLAPRTSDEPIATLLRLAHGTSDVLLALLGWLVLGAPLGVCSLVAGSVVRTRALGEVLGSLALYVLTLCIAHALHVLVVLPALLRVAAPARAPFTYLRGLASAAAVSFGTASSAATLPTTIRSCIAQGVRSETANFVLPLGATINMDGTAQGMTIAVLFVANTNGHLEHMSWADMLTMGLIVCLLSVGAAPIPSSGPIIFALCLEGVGVPITTAYAYILATDWLTDRMRTTVNILSDAFVCAAVDARISGISDDTIISPAVQGAAPAIATVVAIATRS